MGIKDKIQLFEEKKVRTAWDEENEEWYFSIVDVVGVLTNSPNPQVYWRVLKKRLKDEGNETVTNCNGLKMEAPDGKMRMTDEWKSRGLQEGVHFASLTDIIYKTWADKTAKQGGEVARNARIELEEKLGKKLFLRSTPNTES
jgi:hypothetical protein